jgi:acyl dehydratase
VSISAASLKVGDSKEQLLVDDLTRTQIVMYAGASGDYNPLHSDEKFAREVAGYPGIFAHGMLTMGMTGRVVTDWFDVGRVTKYGVRFVRQVWPGATLTATAVVDAIREEDGAQFADVSITTVDAEGTTVLTGTATARLDP